MGTLYRLIEIPTIVSACALDPTWPRVSTNQKEILVRDSLPDTTVLRLALLVHRQLLTVDGVDEAMAIDGVTPSLSSTSTPIPRPPVGPGGDGGQVRKSAGLTTASSTPREADRAKGAGRVPFSYIPRQVCFIYV